MVVERFVREIML